MPRLNQHPVSRLLARLLIWGGSASAAGWLILSEPGSADAVAHLVAPEHRIASVENGRIAEITVTPGQRVRQGQLLARLDTSVLEREIAAAEAKLRETHSASGASLAQLESDGDQAERSFQSDLDSLTSEEEAAKASLARENNEIQSLRAEAARLRNLVRQGLARADRVEELEIRIRSMEASAAQWPARIRSLEQRRQSAAQRLSEWQTRHKVQSSPRLRQAQTAPLEDRAALQTEAIRALRARLQAARLTAPADGEVLSVLARPGDVARAGEPFLILNATSGAPLQLVAYVREKDGDWLQPGDRAILRRRTMGREALETRVARVTSAVVQLPVRFWLTPATPAWGREVILDLPGGAQPALDPGEALDARFYAGRSAGR